MAQPASPKAEGEVKIHSADAFVEVVKHAHPVLPPRAKQAPVSREALEHTAAKESIHNKQRVREMEFLRSMENAKVEAQRRIQERALVKEREFDARLQALLREREGFVRDMGNMVREAEQTRQRSKEELYTEWVRQVYRPTAQRVCGHVDALDMAAVGERKRAALTAYLDVSRKKKGQIFGDIILEAEYDPIQFRAQNHFKYKSEVTQDPCKPKSMRRRNQEKEFAVPALPAVYPKAKCKEMFPVTMWAKVDATPFGRYAIDTRPHGLAKPPVPDEPPVGVSFDDYSHVPMAEVKKIQIQERRELGKRITGPARGCEELSWRGRRPAKVIHAAATTTNLAPENPTSPTSPGRKVKAGGKRYIAVRGSQEAPLLGKRTYKFPRPMSPFATHEGKQPEQPDVIPKAGS